MHGQTKYQTDTVMAAVQQEHTAFCAGPCCLINHLRQAFTKTPTLLQTDATGTGLQQCRCIVPKAVYSQKCSWGWANWSPETCTAEL